MIRIYGSMLCKDCVRCREELDKARVEYEYLDFSESLKNLKAFLKLRDTHDCFGPVREDGKIGIPCILREDETVTLSWEEFI